MSALTTHVLDTSGGRPASGMAVRLYRLGDSRELLTSATTNRDGRCDEPLLQGDDFRTGQYELEFEVGDYFGLDGARFLDRVIIRFGISSALEHYHVPLLISPYGYSTYRGS